MAKYLVWLEDNGHSVEAIDADDPVGAACNVVCEVWWDESETRALWTCRVENVDDCVFNVVEVNIIFGSGDTQDEASGRIVQ